MASEADLLTQVVNNPMFWIIIVLIVFYFILKQYNQGKLRPEQKPDFGVKYRKARVSAHLKRRDEAFGQSVKGFKAMLLRDVYPMGRVLSIEFVPRIIKPNAKNKIKEKEEITLSIITYRRFGFINWLGALLGFCKHRVLTDPSGYAEEWNDNNKQVNIILGKETYYRERGGLLILSKEAEKDFIDEINADADYENAKGFISDFPRRLSNLHPSHAMQTDTMQLESDIEEKHKAGYLSRFRKGN